jgi:hypothetical protein
MHKGLKGLCDGILSIAKSTPTAGVSMLQLIANLGSKLAATVMPFLLRRLYKPERLRTGVKIRVMDGQQGIWIHCGELPNFRAWIGITNLTPVELTLDRFYGALYHGCKLAGFHSLERRVLPTAQETVFMVEADLSGEHVAFIRRNLANRFETFLNVSAYVICRLHDFAIEGREVKTKNVELVNCVPMHPVVDAKVGSQSS